MTDRQRPLYIGIARVSTQRQAQEGKSLDSQDEKLHSWAAYRDVDLEVVQAPARTGKRVSKELKQVLARLTNGEADGLVAARPDRVARRVIDTVSIMAQADREGWNLVILQPELDLKRWTDRAMLHVFAAFAEYESRLNGDRVKDVLRQAQDNGSRIGRPAKTSP
jgi:DNA invertase Pin-like site-specific DNA recombinase